MRVNPDSVEGRILPIQPRVRIAIERHKLWWS